MMAPAADNAEHSQVTAADCQQKHKKSAGHMAVRRRQHSISDSSRFRSRYACKMSSEIIISVVT